MNKFWTLAFVAVALPAIAQERPHLEPYFGVNGGYDEFDRHVGPDTHVQGNTAGALAGGFVGFNVPLGPLVVGAEANGSRGFGDIRWEYGATGELGFRAGKSGQIFARGGYEWIEAKDRRYPENTVIRQREGVLYGIGFEVGPEDLGGFGRAGTRFRVNVDTMNFDSLRTTAGVVFHF